VRMRGRVAVAVATLTGVATVSLGFASIAQGASGLTASAPGVTAKTITIGYITSLTGIASSTFADGPGGVKAAIDAQNAAGGVDGRKLVVDVKDDASSGTTDTTDADELAGSTFGVVDFSAFTFTGAPALQKAGVPVTGEEFDGPEWGQQPYTNMFSYGPPSYTEYNGHFYTYTDIGNFLKILGVKTLANLSYGISPSAVQASKGVAAAAQAVGVGSCYNDYSVAFGSTDFTADALALKQNNCGSLEAPMVDDSDVALSGALKNGGESNIKQIYFTGYSQDVISNAAANASFQGAYVVAGINFVDPSPGVKTMLNNFKKYIPGYSGGIPDLGLYGSYIATELMIKGLELAGKNPTRQAFISKLRNVTGFTANGILPAPVAFNHFGTVGMFPKTGCTYVVQLKGKKFVLANGGKQVCGKLFAYSA
jgi:branched-chain amino acid transport system substrate-binding protein